MKIDVIISANDIKEEKIKGKTVVVIDMLRATSVITTALNNGCKKVIPVLTVEEAKKIAKNSNSGTAGEFSMDDFICGGYIIQCIRDCVEVEMTDIAKTAHYIYQRNNNVIDFIKEAKHYNRLKELGLQEDLKYCCSKDIIGMVPEYGKGYIHNGLYKSK